jgi:hypothetical protein
LEIGIKNFVTTFLIDTGWGPDTIMIFLSLIPQRGRKGRRGIENFLEVFRHSNSFKIKGG